MYATKLLFVDDEHEFIDSQEAAAASLPHIFIDSLSLYNFISLHFSANFHQNIMTDPNEQKAQQKLLEAEKRSKGAGGFLGSLFGGGGRDDAADLYIQAANLFKIAKKWTEAGRAFVKAAELYLARGDAKHDAAQQYAEAANCYRKVNPQLAVDCLVKSAEIYTDMGRFTMAAKHHTTIAELYETDCPDLEQAISHYQVRFYLCFIQSNSDKFAELMLVMFEIIMISESCRLLQR